MYTALTEWTKKQKSPSVKTSRKSNFSWKWIGNKNEQATAQTKIKYANTQIYEYENLQETYVSHSNLWPSPVVRWEHRGEQKQLQFQSKTNKNARIDLTNYVWSDISFRKTAKICQQFCAHSNIQCDNIGFRSRQFFSAERRARLSFFFAFNSRMSWNKWCEFF